MKDAMDKKPKKPKNDCVTSLRNLQDVLEHPVYKCTFPKIYVDYMCGLFYFSWSVHWQTSHKYTNVLTVLLAVRNLAHMSKILSNGDCEKCEH